MHNYLIAFLIIINSSFGVFAQSNLNPCDAPNFDCQNGGANGIIFSFDGDTLNYAAPGTSMPFWIGVGDTNSRVLDISSTAIFALTKLSGPGAMQGLPGLVNPSFFGYFNELNFTIPGIYEIRVNAGIVGFSKIFIVNVLPEISMCIESPSGECNAGNGNEIFAKPQLGVVVPVDAVWPVTVGLIDSVTGHLDSTFSGTIYVDQLYGPGELYGTLSMTGNKWFYFNDLRFTQEGIYGVNFYEEDSLKYKNSELEVEVVKVSIVGINKQKLNTFVVFPNPIKHSALIQFDENLNGLNFTIYDSAGRALFQKNVSTMSSIYSLEVSSLSTGLYTLLMTNSDGVILSKKILIKK